MPAESSFDVVSEFDRQELINAVDQARREISTRYDLKDSKTTIDLDETTLTITTESDMHLTAVRDILLTKAIRRNLSVKIFAFEPSEEVSGPRTRQVAKLQQGIPDDLAKKLQKLIREHAPKVQARIQGDSLRVASKSKDELQTVIHLLRERQEEFAVPLQFNNYR